MQAKCSGIEHYPLVVMRHPLGSLNLSEVKDRAREIAKEVVRILTTPSEILKREGGRRQLVGLRSEGKTIQVRASTDAIDEVNGLFYEKKWTDGLPIVPPTEARVRKMLESVDRDPDEVVACLPPMGGEATVTKIAVNAVMAGCKSEYMPVLIAAVQAMSEGIFNLSALQTTTNPCAPLMIVNGPMRSRLGLNSGAGALGPGVRANATLGRAIRLILLNIGGARPGELDKATQGQPGKYTFCIAENEEESPWEPFHVEKGYEENASTVTIVNATGTLGIVDSASSTAESLLTTLAGGMVPLGTLNLYKGGDPLLVLSPEHASILACDGLSKRQVKEFLFQRATVPLTAFSDEVQEKYIRKRRPDLFGRGSETKVMVTIADKPDDIMIIVCGGPGRHSVFVPTFVNGRTVTKVIETSVN